MRLFVAIDVSELKDKFLGIQSKFPEEFKCTSDFHLTLKFIGDGNPEKIIEKLKKVKFEPITFNVTSIGFFQNQISVIWVGVEPQNEIVVLHEKICNALGSTEKNYVPHITLARAKNIAESFVSSMDVSIDSQIRADCFRLYNSSLTQQGPVYEELFTFR